MRIRKITINLKGNKCDTQTFDILTVSEFCEAVGISRSTWHKLKRQGKAPAIINISGIQRIRWEAVERWLSENEA